MRASTQAVAVGVQGDGFPGGNQERRLGLIVADGQAERTEGVAQVGPGRAFQPVGPEHLRQGFAAVPAIGLGGQVGQQGAGLERFKRVTGSPSRVTSNGPNKRMARWAIGSATPFWSDQRLSAGDQATRCVAMPGQTALLQGSTDRIPSKRLYHQGGLAATCAETAHGSHGFHTAGGYTGLNEFQPSAEERSMEKLVKDRKRRYLAYLLRLWQVWDKGQTDWRASVENAHTGEQQGFAGLAELFSLSGE